MTHKQLKTSRDISGSRIVIWNTSEHYIDVRKGCCDPRSRHGTDIIECVKYGNVYRTVPVFSDDPDTVISIIKEELLNV